MSAAAKFHTDSDHTTADEPRRAAVRKALGNYKAARGKTESAFTSWQHARDAAAEIKYEGLNRLDEMLTEFEAKFTARGGKVFWASTGAQARDYILKLAEEKGVKSIVKSKAMTSEEIHLNDALEKAGYGVIESDLGEFIQQLLHEPPYHFVFPCMHLKREEISTLFERELGSAKTDSPEASLVADGRISPVGDRPFSSNNPTMRCTSSSCCKCRFGSVIVKISPVLGCS